MDEIVQQDWKDAITVILYKGKGAKDVCGNSRGIALLSVIGKAFSRIMLDRLFLIVNEVLTESHCGFRTGRSTIDMTFSARQVQEKCIEQRMDLYQVFIDLRKAFDSVKRAALRLILEKFGCPEKFIKLFRLFYDGMKAYVYVGGNISEAIPVENGVKQGDIPAPTLFALYFTMLLVMAFKECSTGIYIRYRTSGKLFNIRRFGATAKLRKSLIREFLYADDCDIFAHTQSDIQQLMDSFSKSCVALGLTIN